MPNPEQLSIDVAAFAEKTKGKLRAFATEFIQDMNEAVVMATPVGKPPRGTGFLRGSWFAQLNTLPGAQEGAPDKGGTATVSQMNLVAADLKLGDTIYCTNGASYAVYVEYGTSRMAPRAFVRGTIDRAQAIADAAAMRVAGME